MTTKNFTPGFLSALLAGQLIAILPPAAMADNTDIQIAGHTVIVNRTGAEGMSVDQRTAAIQKNLDDALATADDHSPASVKVVRVNGEPVVTLGGYKVATVDAANANLAQTSQLALANKWAAALRRELENSDEVENYIANIGNTTPAANTVPPVAPAPGAAVTAAAAATAPPLPMAGNVQQNTVIAANTPVPSSAAAPTNVPAQAGIQPPLQGQVIFAPAGATMPITLNTAVSSATAQDGDVVQASLTQDLNLGNGVIPAGSLIQGVVTDAEPGRRFDRSGTLSIKFNSLQLADGSQVPLYAHLVGNIGRYADKGGASDTMRGESMKNKFESAALRGAVGAGTGAALGTAIGAIADGGHGAGRGAWSAAAIGGGLGVADSLLLRKAGDVVLKSGTQMQLQLDQPLQIACPPGQAQ